MIPDFPPSFAALRACYADFVPAWELHRQSFPEWFAFYLRQATIADLEAELTKDTQAAREIKSQLRQRLFYRSATSFYRSYDLFLAYLGLQRQEFATWSEITGYYSRFYFIQAFLNLLQANWFSYADDLSAEGLANPADRRFFVYFSGQQYSFLRNRHLSRVLDLEKLPSHQTWWRIYGNLGALEDFPQIESLGFVLGDGYFNPERRNKVNYSHEYVEGFPELEWFDSAPEQMMAHFGFQHRRHDRDITSIERFFAGYDPEDIDPADFYADDAQMLWCSIDCYLRVLGALRIRQDFIMVDKLERLARAHLEDEFPRLIEGIAQSAREALAEQPA